jgi:undecaprenyl-diphosphatase
MAARTVETIRALERSVQMESIDRRQARLLRADTRPPERRFGWRWRAMIDVSALGRSLNAEGSLLPAMAVLSAGLLGFVSAADALDEEGDRTFDLAVLKALHPGPDPSDPIGPAWLDLAITDITSLGSIAVLAIVTLATGGFMFMRGQSVRAMALAVGLGGGVVLSETLKSVFERTRPPEAFRAAEALNYSFPSGHALLSTVVYLTLGAMLAGAVRRGRLKAYILGVSITLAVLVGASRVYLGVHWASDVLAGWCVGAMWAACCWLVMQQVERRRLDKGVASRTVDG